MAGFFGFFDYSKPGPGVPKDGPPKARILVFFEIIQRKFWNLIKVNFMFNLFNIPAALVGLLASMIIFPQIMPGLDMTKVDDVVGDLVSRLVLLTIFLCIPVITVGPAQAGFTYIMRNYAREEHAFIWSDFKEHAAKNFKQSMIVSGIDFLFTCLILFALKVYFLINSNNMLLVIATTMMFLLLAIFMSMHLYIYPMMVTFKLTTKQLYKNALFFGLGKLLPNIGIILLSILILLFTFGMLIPFNPVLGLILYLLITVSFIGMMTNFYAYGKIKKYMMPDEDEEDDEEVVGQSSGEESFDETDGAYGHEADDTELNSDEVGEVDNGSKPVDGDEEKPNTEVKRYY